MNQQSLKTRIADRYELLRLLGRGGMGEVFLARDTLLRREVALKVLRREQAVNEEFAERFKREARNSASLTHPHIVEIYDAGEDEDGTRYIAMEHVPGGTLAERIRLSGRFAPSVAAEVTLQIASALLYAHEWGIVHRDVKPHNILVTERGDVKVADFGIARAAEATALTQTSAIVGSVGYLSPEQAMGEPVDQRVDLYSLGVVLYEMLTGELPFEAESPIGVAMKHVTQAPLSPGEVAPGVPRELARITARLLAKDPDDRYASARELSEELGRFLERRSSPAGFAGGSTACDRRTERRAPRTKRARRRPRAVLGVCVAALATALPVGAYGEDFTGRYYEGLRELGNKEPAPVAPVQDPSTAPPPEGPAQVQGEASPDATPEAPSVAEEPPAFGAPSANSANGRAQLVSYHAPRHSRPAAIAPNLATRVKASATALPGRRGEHTAQRAEITKPEEARPRNAQTETVTSPEPVEPARKLVEPSGPARVAVPKAERLPVGFVKPSRARHEPPGADRPALARPKAGAERTAGKGPARRTEAPNARGRDPR